LVNKENNSKELSELDKKRLEWMIELHKQINSSVESSISLFEKLLLIDIGALTFGFLLKFNENNIPSDIILFCYSFIFMSGAIIWSAYNFKYKGVLIKFGYAKYLEEKIIDKLQLDICGYNKINMNMIYNIGKNTKKVIILIFFIIFLFVYFVIYSINVWLFFWLFLILIMVTSTVPFILISTKKIKDIIPLTLFFTDVCYFSSGIIIVVTISIFSLSGVVKHISSIGIYTKGVIISIIGFSTVLYIFNLFITLSISFTPHYAYKIFKENEKSYKLTTTENKK
jgi:hypothetical protein